DRQSEIGVLADRVARPVAGGFDGGAADQAHGAVDDDGVGLVPLNHADVEETGVFAVHGMVDWASLAVAVILRRLHQAYVGGGERGERGLSAIWDGGNGRHGGGR